MRRTIIILMIFIFLLTAFVVALAQIQKNQPGSKVSPGVETKPALQTLSISKVGGLR